MNWLDTIHRAELMADRITYKPGTRFVVRQDRNSDDPEPRPYVQLHYVDGHGETTHQSHRRYLGKHLTDDELARVFFGLAMTSEKEQCRNSFLVDGLAVFGTHVPLAALLDAARRPRRPALSVVDSGCSHTNTVVRASFRGGRPGAVTQCVDCDAVVARSDRP